MKKPMSRPKTHGEGSVDSHSAHIGGILYVPTVLPVQHPSVAGWGMRPLVMTCLRIQGSSRSNLPRRGRGGEGAITSRSCGTLEGGAFSSQVIGAT